MPAIAATIFQLFKLKMRPANWLKYLRLTQSSCYGKLSDSVNHKRLRSLFSENILKRRDENRGKNFLNFVCVQMSKASLKRRHGQKHWYILIRRNTAKCVKIEIFSCLWQHQKSNKKFEKKSLFTLYPYHPTSKAALLLQWKDLFWSKY